MIGAVVRRIVAVVGGDDHQIILPGHPKDARHILIKLFH